MTIRILLVDDHQMLREGLRTLLEREPDMEVVGEAADGDTAIRAARERLPDVVVMDVAMPGTGGIEATRQIMRADPTVAIVGLSMHNEQSTFSEMIQAGAAEYVLKDAAFEQLVDAIRAAAERRSNRLPSRMPKGNVFAFLSKAFSAPFGETRDGND
ncbi:MAG: response regulator transcription factor [Kiritimatiellae bacterium]|nr:response regulator transcription factor [Kiritimatiellia bacterium]